MQSFKRQRTSSDEDSLLQEAKRLEVCLESPDEKDDDRLLEMVENSLDASVLEKLSEESLNTVLRRLSKIKASTLAPGLILAVQQIVRFAATEGVNYNSKMLALLRRNSALSILAGVLTQLASAAGQLQNLHRIEEMMVGSVESIGWLSAKESSEAIEAPSIKKEAPTAMEAVSSTVEQFPSFLRLQVIGHAAMSWLKQQVEGEEDAAWLKAAEFTLNGLKQDRDTELQCLAVLAFGWLTFSSPATGKELVRQAGAKSLVNAMQRHPLHRR